MWRRVAVLPDVPRSKLGSELALLRRPCRARRRPRQRRVHGPRLATAALRQTRGGSTMHPAAINRGVRATRASARRSDERGCALFRGPVAVPSSVRDRPALCRRLSVVDAPDDRRPFLRNRPSRPLDLPGLQCGVFITLLGYVLDPDHWRLGDEEILDPCCKRLPAGVLCSLSAGSGGGGSSSRIRREKPSSSTTPSACAKCITRKARGIDGVRRSRGSWRPRWASPRRTR